MKRGLALILLAIGVAITGCPNGGEGEGEGEGERDYRQDMRDFVQRISEYARDASSGFAVIPQNGHELLTEDGEADGPAAADYVTAIDGVGREDLFYGYTADNVATPAAVRDSMLAFMDLAEANAVDVLATDYCSTHTFMDNSYAWNAGHGFISFAANHRDLDNIPLYPAAPYAANADDVTALSDARNFLYLLDPGQFDSKQAFLDALAQTDYDLFIIDLFFDEEALTAADVASLKVKPQGGARLVIAYMSIGEAEDYRYYWDDAWEPGDPAWLAEENPNWRGNFKVRYWESGWQNVILGSEDAYLDRILAAGFDGVYLDIIDAFEYFEDQ